MARGPMDLWNEWATQILVLLSLALQVVLLLSADIRRREASPVPRFFLWLAYQLADSTAIYAVGYLSLSSIPREHQLVAFWAPFLLLHLGGPDNITAYALEDNKLWTRHFITLVVQVLGAGYILYKHIAATGSLVVLAAVLMLVVGVLKYGERTWALWCANFSSIRSSPKVLSPRTKHHLHFYTEHQGYPRGAQDVDEESLLQRAHSLFDICKRGIVESVIKVDSEDNPDTEEVVSEDNPDTEEVVSEDNPDTKIIRGLMDDDREGMWTVMEMELSLMYEILYTKANVIHSYFGYCIRVVSPLAIVASLLLFQFSGKEGHSGVDVAITYVLLGGAFVMETNSLLSALGSSWALPFLCATPCSWLRHAALCTGRWHRLRRALLSLPWPAKITTASSRRRSGNMGQYSMLHFPIGQLDPRRLRFGDFAKKMGFSEWRDRWCGYSWTVPIPEEVKKRTQRLDKEISLKNLNTMGLLRYNWGEWAMSRHDGLRESLKGWTGVDFYESIIIWHIATDLFLSRSTRAKAEDAVDRVDAIGALSNYMMFLLVERPDMLPGLPQNWLYQKTCDNLDEICKKNRAKLLNSQGRTNVCTMLKKLFRFSRLEQTKDMLAGFVLDHDWEKPDYKKVPRLSYACQIAKILLRREEDAVDVLLDMWTDFLVYAANRCNRESHAKKLDSGGELTTVVWLMIEHLSQIKEGAKKGAGNV